MVQHIVMWRLKDGIDKQEVSLKIKNALESLKSQIPELQEVTVGININTTENASDIVLITAFQSLEDLNAYIEHPAHKEVGKTLVRPNVAERRVVDFHHILP